MDLSHLGELREFRQALEMLLATIVALHSQTSDWLQTHFCNSSTSFTCLLFQGVGVSLHFLTYFLGCCSASGTVSVPAL